MASTDLGEELNCSICLEVYTDPVTLRCGHNYCQECIKGALDSQESSGFYTCPECRKRFRSRPSLVKNTTLGNIAGLFHATQPQAGNTGVICTYCDLPNQAVKSCLECGTSMCERHLRGHNRSVQHILIDPTTSLENRKCPVHKKFLGYYCSEDSAFICASCGMNNGHQVEPLEEALKKRKEKLGEVLEKVNSKTEEAEKIVQNLNENVSKIQGKANDITKGISEMFRDMTRQLEVLKDTLIAEVLSKKEQSLLPLTDHIQELEKEKEELLRSKRRIEELCDMDDPFTVLQEHQTGLRDRVTRSDAHVHSSDELDVGLISRTLQTRLADITSGGNLCFYVQEPTDLLLDVTTASNNVRLSDDLRSATYTEVGQNLPDSTQRFPLCQVLSSRSFSSGRHYWDVETSPSGNWRVGVCYPSMDRRGDLSEIGYNSKSWCLRRCMQEFGVRHNAQCLTLSQVSSCNHLRVYLDYEAGQLSFYELSDSIRHLYTYNATFTEPLHAAFMVFESWLRVRGPGNRSDGTVPALSPVLCPVPNQVPLPLSDNSINIVRRRAAQNRAILRWRGVTGLTVRYYQAHE